MMKEQVNIQEIRRMNQDGIKFSMLLIVTVVSIAPLFMYLEGVGVCIWTLLAAITMYYAIRIEKQKKTHDVQTYKEVLAFMSGQKLDEMEKVRES